MRMIIVNIEYKNDCIFVVGNTSIGSIKGRWCYSEKPIIGETYFFELLIDEVDRNEISILYNQIFKPSVSYIDDKVKFKGICEEVDDIYVVRFAIDWIEMISVKNDDFTIREGDKIEYLLNYKCIGIYPY